LIGKEISPTGEPSTGEFTNSMRLALKPILLLMIAKRGMDLNCFP
jgi:hypothetical protein